MILLISCILNLSESIPTINFYNNSPIIYVPKKLIKENINTIPPFLSNNGEDCSETILISDPISKLSDPKKLGAYRLNLTAVIISPNFLSDEFLFCQTTEEKGQNGTILNIPKPFAKIRWDRKEEEIYIQKNDTSIYTSRKVYVKVFLNPGYNYALKTAFGGRSISPDDLNDAFVEIRHIQPNVPNVDPCLRWGSEMSYPFDTISDGPTKVSDGPVFGKLSDRLKTPSDRVTPQIKLLSEGTRFLSTSESLLSKNRHKILKTKRIHFINNHTISINFISDRRLPGSTSTSLPPVFKTPKAVCLYLNKYHQGILINRNIYFVMDPRDAQCFVVVVIFLGIILPLICLIALLTYAYKLRKKKRQVREEYLAIQRAELEMELMADNNQEQS